MQGTLGSTPVAVVLNALEPELAPCAQGERPVKTDIVSLTMPAYEYEQGTQYAALRRRIGCQLEVETQRHLGQGPHHCKILRLKGCRRLLCKPLSL